MTKTMPPSPRPPAERFRRLIAEAENDGVERTAMVLRVTLGDAAKLKRDPLVEIAEISFLEGEMRFLGVKVVAGSVTESALDRGAAVET